MELFWMVWNEGNMVPTVKHGTEGEARKEAERLAQKHPSQKFYVLVNSASCTKCDIVWEEI